MIAIFSLRLACGLTACLLILSPAQVNPRFFRTQFLTVLGLLGVATFFLAGDASTMLLLILASGFVVSFVGSIVWHLADNPGGRFINVLAAALTLAALVLAATELHPDAPAWLVADDVTAAFFLGAATTAMLMGHSYLIAPAMSLTPLMTLLCGLGISLLARVILAGAGLWLWTKSTSAPSLEAELVLWLSVRWVIGFLGPLVLGWMAWETARIRSTPSATGILYVVVILCFLGELTSLLLREQFELFF
jgi:hypothetical protein